MVDLFPKKSLFGFRILNSFHSTLGAYGLTIWLLIQIRLFNYYDIDSLLSDLFIIISNLSILILTINSIIQALKKNIKILWIILNLPLWIYIPFLLRVLIESILRALVIIE